MASEARSMQLEKQDKNKPNLFGSSRIKINSRSKGWRNAAFYVFAHFAGIHALTLTPPPFYTVLFNVALHVWTVLSILVGTHRLWSHKSYKAKWPLRLFFVMGQSFGMQFSLYKWVWLHRLHHKYTDTDADPHNSKRGFFFTHIGWVFQQHHEEVYSKKKTLDLRDLEEDWMVMWQDKLYPVLGPVSCFVVPVLIPYCLWDEDMWTAVCFNSLRWVASSHSVFMVNSLSHMVGTRPYDSNISPTNNVFVTIFTFGEGAHNYHHVFPWDYKDAESKNYFLNGGLLFLDLCGKLGLAYDFKEASPEMVLKRKLRTGNQATHSANLVWGLEDEDMDEHDKNMIKRLL